MTIRTDVVVDFSQTPRVAVVASPSTEYTMQDLVDTERDFEASFSGMSYNKLLNASGKEDLGGGVVVGITVAHQDTLVSFEGRFTPAESSTITSASAAPVGGTVFLTDATATFISNSVKRGSAFINFDDRGIGDVVEVVSETILRVTTPVNGDVNDFQIGDRYDVYNITQCNATGGNLTAVDTVPVTIDAVLPTWGTQIVVTASSSATTSESQDIQYASFNGGVTIDTLGATTGTTFPTGTSRMPVNNLTDALAIATLRGFSTYFIMGDVTLSAGPDLSNSVFIGESKTRSLITVDASATVDDCEYSNAMLTGTLDGSSKAVDCEIVTLNLINGYLEQCVLSAGTISLGGAETAHFLDCWSGVAGAGTPIIDMGASGQALAMRNYNGGIELRNKSGSDDVSIDLNSGQVVLHSTVTAGTILVRGVGKLTDNSVGATVVDETVSGEWMRSKLLTIAKWMGLR